MSFADDVWVKDDNHQYSKHWHTGKKAMNSNKPAKGKRGNKIQHCKHKVRWNEFNARLVTAVPFSLFSLPQVSPVTHSSFTTRPWQSIQNRTLIMTLLPGCPCCVPWLMHWLKLEACHTQVGLPYRLTCFSPSPSWHLLLFCLVPPFFWELLPPYIHITFIAFVTSCNLGHTGLVLGWALDQTGANFVSFSESHLLYYSWLV